MAWTLFFFLFPFFYEKRLELNRREAFDTEKLKKTHLVIFSFCFSIPRFFLTGCGSVIDYIF